MFKWQKSLTAASNSDTPNGGDEMDSQSNSHQQSRHQPRHPQSNPLPPPTGQPANGRHSGFDTPPRGSSNNHNRRGGRGRSRGNYPDPRTPHFQRHNYHDYDDSPRRSNDYTTAYESDSYYYNHPPVYTENRFLPLRDIRDGPSNYQRPHQNQD